ncbi:MAG: asparagine synthetase B [Bacteroidota bacterium]
MKKAILSICTVLVLCGSAFASYIMIPMNEHQKNHLKAYGIAYWVLTHDVEVHWLLNYEGGSFAFKNNILFQDECITRDVSYEIIPDAKFTKILQDISHPERNMDAIKLEVAPKVAVYTPDVNAKGETIQPWDDAVTLVLTYAEIPYDVIYDTDVLEGKLAEYDWLHLHHEDFTGQYGKFYASYGSRPWYREHVKSMEDLAEKHGFAKVSHLKLAVAKMIQAYVSGGGFMFAMCSATDTYDIAIASEGLDIIEHMYDGDPQDPTAQDKLNFTNTFAFQDFKVVRDPLRYEHSNIDATHTRKVDMQNDYFTLFDFSAKWDPVPSMLTQNHTRTVKGFMGQTTAFRKELIKSNVLVMGENKPANEARYIHAEFGFGTWTFFGGHDPEDYRHYVHDPPTDLNLHPNSPGYRLILNNVLFPAAKKKKRKT